MSAKPLDGLIIDDMIDGSSVRHVYPLSRDMPDIEHEHFDDPFVTDRPIVGCVLCEAGICTQRLMVVQPMAMVVIHGTLTN